MVNLDEVIKKECELVDRNIDGNFAVGMFNPDQQYLKESIEEFLTRQDKLLRKLSTH